VQTLFPPRSAFFFRFIWNQHSVPSFNPQGTASQRRGKTMKTLTTILAAAFIAGSAGLAMAQTTGGAGTDVNPDRINKGADQNPTTKGANPAAGSTDADTKGSAKSAPTGGAMQTAPVAGTPKKDSSTPAQAPTDEKKK
jgi:hypothetical protein